MRCVIAVIVSAMALAMAPLAMAPATAQETEVLMLSGTGYGDDVLWQLEVSGGRRAGEWAEIPVPSQWQQHGFGAYDYGHDDDKSREQGRYRHRFRVPAGWRGKTVDLVFEGVMTDAEAKLNGQLAGPVHRGAFYRFRYDVTDLLRAGAENLLEVTVSKHSADASVNRAEREADYWVFGGIYRPVYLEARPPESIGHVAIDARHDGTLSAVVRPRTGAAASGSLRLTGRVETLGGEAAGAPLVAEVRGESPVAELRARFAGIRAWSAESPDLYNLIIELERDGQVLHRHAERFGFRTIEARGDGLWVNGHRVLLKGVNRHAFWPASGRTLNREIDFRDAELIKGMNMNAVRASHYPPDEAFLEACDELGIYVIDELAGWHDAYGTAIGRRLVGEMVERDVNHPSVILWANGNEGGWNRALDEVFAEHDVQQRGVIHPHESFGGFDTGHYPTFARLQASLDPASLKNRWRSLFGDLPLVMPTELLHGLYDGGSGAGLEDYWRRLRASPRGAGAFLWSFADEAIERVDRGGALDTDGNHAPDGVLGPYRELSGNSYAVAEIFSPVRIVGERRFDGGVQVENRFDMTDLSDCRFDWSLLDLPAPGLGPIATLGAGTFAGPTVAPGERGRLRLPPGVDWQAADAVSLTARDPSGRGLWTWVLPTHNLRTAPSSVAPSSVASSSVASAAGESIEVTVRGHRLILRAASAVAELDLQTGCLRGLERTADGGRFDLAGPLPVEGGTAVPVWVRHRPRKDAYAVDVRYRGDLTSAHWLFLRSGWLRLSYSYQAEGAKDFFGVRFALGEEMLASPPSGGGIEKVRWLGDGPARVWKNRAHGGTLGLWEKATAGLTPVEAAHEPKLAGYYSGVVWAELATAGNRLIIAFESSGAPRGGKWDDIYLSLFTPSFPADARDAVAPAPGGISLLHGISAIGTKFHPPEDLGPRSRRAVASGAYRGVVWFYLGPRAWSEPDAGRE